VNPALITTGGESAPEVVFRKVEAAVLDEMWSCVGGKTQLRWLWEALEHSTGRI